MKKFIASGATLAVGVALGFAVAGSSTASADPVTGVRGVAYQSVTSLDSGTSIGFNDICPTADPLPISASAFQYDPAGDYYATQKVLHAEISPSGSNNAVKVDIPAHPGTISVAVVAFCAAV